MKLKLHFCAAIIALSFFFSTHASAQITINQNPDCFDYDGVPLALVSLDPATGRKYYDFGGGVFTLGWSITNNRWELMGPAGLLASNTSTSIPNPPLTGWVATVCGAGSLFLTSTLPVEMVRFDAFTEGTKNTLEWETASEVNNKAFEIERSTDGTKFTTIGKVNALNKASNYQYIDNQPLAVSYYRLRQIDNDGSFSFSKVVSVANKNTKAVLSVYPTLVADVLNISTEDVSNYQVFNLLGQQVLSGAAASRIDVGSLTKGTYFLRIGTEQVRFMKQ
jgi:hypothetical protein